MGGGVAFQQRVQGISERDGTLPGVYTVVQDAKPSAAQLSEDTRWQQIAFGQWSIGRKSQLAIRTANGDLQLGRYTESAPGTLQVELHPVQQGETKLPNPVTRSTTLTWQELPDGGLRLTGDGQDVTLAPAPEARFLFDRGFQWGPRPAVNR